jgi:hypothetical protein
VKLEFAVGMLIVAAIFGVLVQCTGCTPAPALPAYCTNEVAFTAALARCVDKSPTRAESRACRADVHARCGITMTVSKRSVAP